MDDVPCVVIHTPRGNGRQLNYRTRCDSVFTQFHHCTHTRSIIFALVSWVRNDPGAWTPLPIHNMINTYSAATAQNWIAPWKEWRSARRGQPHLGHRP
jgi:hypothetical protein